MSSEAKPWAAASIGRGAGEGVLLTARGCGVPRGVMGLQDSVVGPSYAGRSERARGRVCERCSGGRGRGSLAGHIEGVLTRNRGVRESYGAPYGGAYGQSYGLSSTRPYELMESVVTSTTIENWRAIRGGLALSSSLSLTCTVPAPVAR